MNGDEWEHRQEEGHRLYQAGLAKHLAWAGAYVQTFRQNVQALRDELGNILVLLAHAQEYADYHRQALDVILALGQLPYRLSYRGDWEHHLWFATTLCERQGLHDEWAWLLNHLADILFHQGDMFGTVGIGQAIHALNLKGAAGLTDIMASVRSIDSMLYQNDVAEARRMFELLQTGTLIQELPDDLQPVARAYVRFIEGVLLRHEGRLELARGALTAGIDLFDVQKPAKPPVLAELYRLRGLTTWSTGDYQQARDDLRQAVHIHRHNLDFFAESQTRGNLGLVYWSMARLDRAETVTKRSVRIARSLGARLEEVAQTINLGLVYLSKGWIKRALPLFNTQIRQAQYYNVISEYNRARVSRAIALYHLGHYARARDELELNIEAGDKPLSQAIAYVNLSRCYSALGSMTEAQRLAHVALTISQDTGSMSLRIGGLRALAECDASSRVEYLNEALQLARSHKRRLDEAACLLTLAHLTQDKTLWQQGEKILQMCEADTWLKGTSIDNPPKILLSS